MNAMTSKAIRLGGVFLWLVAAARPATAQREAYGAEGLFNPAAREDLVEPQARRWKTFVLASGSELRLPPPPRPQLVRAELEQMKHRIGNLTEADLAKIRFWDAGSPSYRWVEIAIAQFQAKPMTPPKVYRGHSMMHVAIFDALVTAWDSKYYYARRRPSALAPHLETAAETPNSPSYPSEHAVVAGAASEILAYLYPADAQVFRDKALEAADSRVLAGVQFPSDTTSGLDLGRAVAERVIERAKADGSDAVWTGTVPPGPGKWNGTNPQDPLAGTWTPWILTTADEFRPGPPPAYDSPEEAADLAEIKNFPRTFASNAAAFYWQTVPGLYADWYNTAGKRIFEHHLDKNPPRAARIYALLSIAHYDAILAVFDAKYAYW
ncbi:MAG TPA: phosphatase PAP2 family protein, partial [Thermoanaerobaculia bacterium]